VGGTQCPLGQEIVNIFAIESDLLNESVHS
jgi:hypothetical protein